ERGEAARGLSATLPRAWHRHRRPGPRAPRAVSRDGRDARRARDHHRVLEHPRRASRCDDVCERAHGGEAERGGAPRRRRLHAIALRSAIRARLEARRRVRVGQAQPSAFRALLRARPRCMQRKVTADERDLGVLDGPVLVFGGPYSNLEAAQAIRAEAARLGIPRERTICTGDIVAYCADPGATVALIRDWGIPVV